MSSQQLKSAQSNPTKSISAWKLSKIVKNEVFLDGSIATSGPQKDRILERMSESRNYLQNSTLLLKIISAVFALAVYSLVVQSIQGTTYGVIQDIIFSLSTSISMAFVFQFMFVFTYGMIGLIGFFSSSAFQYLFTLPISRKKIRATSYLVYFRLIDWQIAAIFLGLPIAVGTVIGLLTGSWLIVIFSILISTVISFVNVIFLFSLMLSISLFLAKKLYKPTGGSKGKSLLQLIVSLLYAVVSLGGILAITYLVQIIDTPFGIGTHGSLINTILNFFLYPFGLSYLQAIIVIGPLLGWYYVPLQNIMIAIVGFALTAGLTYLIFRRSMKILYSLTKQEEYDVNHQKAKDVVVSVDIKEPIQAIFKKDITFTFRNFQTTLYFLFTILMPLVLLIQIFAETGTGGYEEFFMISILSLVYSGICLAFAIMVATAPESETGGLVYILPSKMKDIYRAKRRLMIFPMFLSGIAPSAILILHPLIGDIYSRDYLIPGILISISIFVIYYYGTELALTLYARLFGKIRNKFTIQMLNVKHKILKIILGMVILYVACFIPIVVGMIFGGLLLGESVLYTAVILLGTAIVMLGVIRVISFKLFNSH